MVKLLIGSFFILMAGAGLAQASVILTVSNVQSDKGVCRACLFDSEEAFDSKASKPVQCASAIIKDRRSQLQFNGLSTGSYAIFVYHDENNNEQLDRNFIGIPKEGYGASRNKLPYASAPSFQENSFTIQNKTRITLPVRLRNLF